MAKKTWKGTSAQALGITLDANTEWGTFGNFAYKDSGDRRLYIVDPKTGAKVPVPLPGNFDPASVKGKGLSAMVNGLVNAAKGVDTPEYAKLLQDFSAQYGVDVDVAKFKEMNQLFEAGLQDDTSGFSGSFRKYAPTVIPALVGAVALGGALGVLPGIAPGAAGAATTGAGTAGMAAEGVASAAAAGQAGAAATGGFLSTAGTIANIVGTVGQIAAPFLTPQPKMPDQPAGADLMRGAQAEELARADAALNAARKRSQRGTYGARFFRTSAMDRLGSSLFMTRAPRGTSTIPTTGSTPTSPGSPALPVGPPNVLTPKFGAPGRGFRVPFGK